MKKVFFALAVLIISAPAFAQFNQGTMMVGGSAGLEFSKNKYKIDGNSSENSRSTDFYLEPQFGIFVIDNFAIGAGLGLGVSKTKYNGPFDNDETVTSTAITFEPFARYYLPQRIFFQGRFLLGTGTTKWDEAGDSDKTNFGLFGLGVSAGYAIMLNDNIAIEPQLGYQSQARKNEDSDGRSVDSGLYLRVGIQAYLSR
jgi:opacity protein-like surface antigen